MINLSSIKLVCCLLCQLAFVLHGNAQTDILAHATMAVTMDEVKHPRDVLSWGHITLEAWRNPNSDSAYWLRLDPVDIPSEGYLSFGGQRSVQVWKDDVMTTVPYELGLSVPMHHLPVRGSPDILPVESISRSANAVYVRIAPYSQQPYPIEVHHLRPGDLETIRQERNSDEVGYNLFIGSGVLALMFLGAFALFQYLENKKRAYLFYSLYMICMALYFVRLLEYHFETPVFWGFFHNGYGLAEVVALMISYVMYVLFVKHFLRLDEEARPAGMMKFVHFWIGLCVLIAITPIALAAMNLSSALFFEIYTAVRFAMPLMVIYFLWRIARLGSPYAKYVILGSMFLLLGAVCALAVTFLVRDIQNELLDEPFFFMLSGVLLESFCFALGLGKQARQAEIEKLETQKELIVRLEKEARLERDLRESQIQTLRAQMNPHFIFNALNSIQHFILASQTETAVKYLSKISQLIRRILQNSTAPHLKIDDELQTLKEYVEVEQLRFHPAFAFQCIVDPTLEVEMLRIPNMMIQPFVENAILHGLKEKKDKGVLTLEVRPHTDESIEVVVTDNGIGREEAARIAGQSRGKHASISSGSIEQRIRLLLPQEEHPVVFVDLKDNSGRSAGTQVRLRIPVV